MTREEMIEAARSDAERRRDEAAAKAVALSDERSRLVADRDRLVRRLIEIEGHGGYGGIRDGSHAAAVADRSLAETELHDLAGPLVRVARRDGWALAVLVANGPKKARVRMVGGQVIDSIPGHWAPDIHPDDRHLIRCLSEAR